MSHLESQQQSRFLTCQHDFITFELISYLLDCQHRATTSNPTSRRCATTRTARPRVQRLTQCQTPRCGNGQTSPIPECCRSRPNGVWSSPRRLLHQKCWRRGESAPSRRPSVDSRSGMEISRSRMMISSSIPRSEPKWWPQDRMRVTLHQMMIGNSFSLGGT